MINWNLDKENRFYTGSINSWIGGRIVAEIIIQNEIFEARMYKTIVFSDKDNKIKKFNNVKEAKKWCEKQVEGWTN